MDIFKRIEADKQKTLEIISSQKSLGSTSPRGSVQNMISQTKKPLLRFEYKPKQNS